MTERIPFARLSEIAFRRAGLFRATREYYHPMNPPTEEERAMEAFHHLARELHEIGDDLFRQWVWEQRKRRAKEKKR